MCTSPGVSHALEHGTCGPDVLPVTAAKDLLGPGASGSRGRINIKGPSSHGPESDRQAVDETQAIEWREEEWPCQLNTLSQTYAVGRFAREY